MFQNKSFRKISTSNTTPITIAQGRYLRIRACSHHRWGEGGSQSCRFVSSLVHFLQVTRYIVP